MDLTAGSVFQVPTGRGCRTTVTVPDGLGPGDVLSISISLGRPNTDATDGDVGEPGGPSMDREHEEDDG